jgi:hypothetical protein
MSITSIFNNIKKFINEKPVEIYIMWGILIITVLIIILAIYNRLTCYDPTHSYIQYYL